MTVAENIAAEVAGALDGARQIMPFSQRHPQFDTALAYRVTAALRSIRQARGEKQTGRKIGFTNRSIWEQYRIDRPIWGDMFDTTLHAAEPGTIFDLAGFSEPQIEPEIAFGIGSPPKPEMSEDEILGCIEWVAHGFEIVQSIFPRWAFSAADTIAAGGLHGAYLIGPRIPVADIPGAARALRDFAIELQRDGQVVDRGSGRNVLGSPLLALRHLLETLAADPHNPPLRAGEIVTTGTLTRAFPVAPGETWNTVLAGIGLPGLRATFG